MRSIIFKIMLRFCQVVFVIGLVVIPFIMQFNPELRTLLNVWVLCLFGFIGATMGFQWEEETIKEDYDYLTIKYKIYNGEIFKYNGEEYEGLDYEQLIKDVQEELQTLSTHFIKDEEGEDELY